MMEALVSIIVPAYNAEDYLEECLNSIVDQTYKKLEIIVVDDGSTDRSTEICDEYSIRDSRVRVLHQKNAGVAAKDEERVFYTPKEIISVLQMLMIKWVIE